jgi:hypothetical protein|tara:strand:+ start:15501 stop:15863 length:363 start_codon:yes stop_codon:yes gene_type:complete
MSENKKQEREEYYVNRLLQNDYKDEIQRAIDLDKLIELVRVDGRAKQESHLEDCKIVSKTREELIDIAEKDIENAVFGFAEKLKEEFRIYFDKYKLQGRDFSKKMINEIIDGVLKEGLKE